MLAVGLGDDLVEAEGQPGEREKKRLTHSTLSVITAVLSLAANYYNKMTWWVRKQMYASSTQIAQDPGRRERMDEADLAL